MQNSLEIITIQPQTLSQSLSHSKPQGVIVALHGYGANAADLAELAPELDLPNYLMLFPQAPFAHQNAKNGKIWYEFNDSNANQLQISRERLKTYLTEVVLMGIPTFLLGFSQGGAMTLDIAQDASAALNLAGYICLSGYLHPDLKASAVNASILMVHGTEDAVVPIIAAKSAEISLTKLGAKVSYVEFAMGHTINAATLAAVKAFVTAHNFTKD